VSTPDEIKADIEATRAELAETADALAAKLDVKAQASDKLHAAGERLSGKVSERYGRARRAAPAPVQKAMGKAERAAQPLLATAAEDKKRTTLVIAGAGAVLLLIRRVRK
jgi:redox-regulated HSP33 family molecular chaperone